MSVEEGCNRLAVSKRTNNRKPRIKEDVARISKSLLRTVTTILSSLLSCYPLRGATEDDSFSLILEDMPNEVILKIISFCDFSSKMTMRAVNQRFHAIVDECAHAFARRNIVGGVEIRESSTSQETQKYPDDMLPSTSSGQITLHRSSKRRELLLPAGRLRHILRHVCVCHSLKLRGLALDEGLTKDILSASFRTMNDLIVDRVHTVTAETLNKLVTKVYPKHSLHIRDHSNGTASDSIRPEILTSCIAMEVNIQSKFTVMHSWFDDASLVSMVVADEVVRRVIRLPLSQITHHGINKAARAFYKKCCELIGEMTREMLSPIWEVTVSLPRSLLIDRSEIKVPYEMREQCAIWGHLPPNRDSFTVEVRVGMMNLRIMVESM